MMLIGLFFLLSAVHSSKALSFNCTVFNGGDSNITYERPFVNRDGEIQLTTDNRASIGRATYHEPMHVWDNSTGDLTDFSSYFSFIIDIYKVYLVVRVGERLPLA